jgi:hypothetical protein
VRVRRHGWLLVGTVLLAYAATACGAAESSGAAASPSASASASASPQEALSARELKSLAITGDEVPGNRGVSADERDPSTMDNTFPPVSDSSCQKMLDALGAGTASAVVDGVINWKDRIYAGGFGLASYDGTEAEDTFARVRTSLKTCADYTGVGYTGKVSAHVATEKIARVGDESIAFRTTTPVNDHVRNEQLVLVRVGQVTALFSMLDVDHSGHFPMDLIRKQVNRLARAQHA